MPGDTSTQESFGEPFMRRAKSNGIRALHSESSTSSAENPLPKPEGPRPSPHDNKIFEDPTRDTSTDFVSIPYVIPQRRASIEPQPKTCPQAKSEPEAHKYTVPQKRAITAVGMTNASLAPRDLSGLANACSGCRSSRELAPQYFYFRSCLRRCKDPIVAAARATSLPERTYSCRDVDTWWRDESKGPRIGSQLILGGQGQVGPSTKTQQLQEHQQKQGQQQKLGQQQKQHALDRGSRTNHQGLSNDPRRQGDSQPGPTHQHQVSFQPGPTHQHQGNTPQGPRHQPNFPPNQTFNPLFQQQTHHQSSGMYKGMGKGKQFQAPLAFGNGSPTIGYTDFGNPNPTLLEPSRLHPSIAADYGVPTLSAYASYGNPNPNLALPGTAHRANARNFAPSRAAGVDTTTATNATIAVDAATTSNAASATSAVDPTPSNATRAAIDAAIKGGSSPAFQEALRDLEDAIAAAQAEERCRNALIERFFPCNPPLF